MTDALAERKAIQATGQAVLVLLDKEAEDAEAKDKASNGWSMALYALGVVFSLTGQLLGVKNDALGS